jgi:hypothetical protein
MKTYWFTIACNPTFEALCQGLQSTARHHGIEIHQVTIPSRDRQCVNQATPAAEAKRNILRLKIDSILHAPSGYDRMVYLDADTLIVTPVGIDRLQGSLKEPWPTGRSPVPKTSAWLQSRRWRKRLWALLRKENLESFCPGGADYKQEWNSGVIAGDRKFMEDLAQKWSQWWELMIDICDGRFERDQLSYKFAYTLVARRQYGFETIPKTYNCMVKRMGFLPTANILHRAGLPKGEQGWRYRQKRQHWATARQMILSNNYQRWSQQL